MTSASKRSTKRQRSRVRVAASAALALVMVLPVEASASTDHFVNKLSRGVTERVSVSSSGVEGDDDSGGRSGCAGGYSTSDDGRFVAFGSTAGNLHPNDINGKGPDVFVYDRKKKELDLVSATPNGLSAAASPAEQPILCGGSHSPHISGDGRYVAFVTSFRLNQDFPGPEPAVSMVYVRDLRNQKTELVSGTGSNDEVPDGDSGNRGISISDNGRWVAFTSAATNILENECPPAEDILPGTPHPSPPPIACEHVYVRDRAKKKTTLVSKATPDMPSGYRAEYPSLSGNGRHLSFVVVTNRPPLQGFSFFECPPTEAGCSDVFVSNLRTGKTELVSFSRDENGVANAPSGVWGEGGNQLSDNGRYVAFESHASDLVPANPPPYDSLGTVCFRARYVRDRKTGRVERVSVTSTGARLHIGAIPRLSDDGRYSIFRGKSFEQGCLNNATDESGAFHGDLVHDRLTGQVDMVSCTGNDRGGINKVPGCPKVSSEFDRPQIAGNGRVIVGTHYDPEVVPGDTNEAYDVFARDIGHYPLGVGPLGGPPPKDKEPSDDRICVAPDVCVPPQSSLSWRAGGGTASELEVEGAKLYGASLAYRPELGDLYAAIDLEHMGPGLTIGPAGIVTGGLSSLLYGLRFQVRDRTYEVRATSLLGGTFGLFDCTDTAPLCSQMATLKGGYGTTGERVVVSLPLDEIGLEHGGNLRNVAAFSGLGSYLSGATKLLDSVRIK